MGGESAVAQPWRATVASKLTDIANIHWLFMFAYLFEYGAASLVGSGDNWADVAHGLRISIHWKFRFTNYHW